MTTETKLSPEQIDELCMAFDAAAAANTEAGQKLSSAKGDLVAVIRAQGFAPAHAEKTLRLEGKLYAADATEGSTVEMNESAIAELQSELSRLKRPSTFKKLFARRVSHQLATKDGAGVLKLAVGHLPADEQKRLFAIFAQCFTVGVKAPSVKVQLIKALREKEAKAAKKAKKAAKQ